MRLVFFVCRMRSLVDRFCEVFLDTCAGAVAGSARGVGFWGNRGCWWIRIWARSLGSARFVEIGCAWGWEADAPGSFDDLLFFTDEAGEGGGFGETGVAVEALQTFF